MYITPTDIKRRCLKVDTNYKIPDLQENDTI